MERISKIQNFNNPVATNIDRIIEEKGLKQCVVAEGINITPQALTDVIKGRRIIKVSEVNAIAKFLDVTVDELFKSD